MASLQRLKLYKLMSPTQTEGLIINLSPRSCSKKSSRSTSWLILDLKLTTPNTPGFVRTLLASHPDWTTSSAASPLVWQESHLPSQSLITPIWKPLWTLLDFLSRWQWRFGRWNWIESNVNRNNFLLVIIKNTNWIYPTVYLSNFFALFPSQFLIVATGLSLLTREKNTLQLVP